VVRAARKFRRVFCITLGAVATLGIIALLVVVYQNASPDDIAFVTIGDWGCGPDNCLVPATAPLGDQEGGVKQLAVAEALANTAKAIGSRFVLALGDNFYWHGVSSVADPLWKSVWEDRFSAPSLQTPWYVILGNHDHYGNAEAQIDFARQELDCQGFKNCPARWTLPRFWYSKVVESSQQSFTAEFVFIDTVILSEGTSQALAEQRAAEGKLPPEALAKWNAWAEQRKLMAKLQLEWFEATLKASTAEWLIVVGHYPVFSGGEHGNTPELQEQVKPLLEKYKVNAYLCGHDHTLQVLQSNGVHYFVSGAAALNGEYRTIPQSLWGATTTGFMAHRIMKDRMDVSAVTKDGRTVYRSLVPSRRAGKGKDAPVPGDLEGAIRADETKYERRLKNAEAKAENKFFSIV